MALAFERIVFVRASGPDGHHGPLKPPWGPPPDSHARNHDLALYEPDRASDRGISPDAVQAVAYLAGFFGEVAFTFENDALSFLEVRDAVTEVCPFRDMFHSYSLCPKLLCRFCRYQLRHSEGRWKIGSGDGYSPSSTCPAEQRPRRIPIRRREARVQDCTFTGVTDQLPKSSSVTLDYLGRGEG
jgi:hypothetical protein